MLKLDVRALKEEKGRQEHYDLELEPSELNNNDEQISFSGTIAISLDLVNTGPNILLTGTIKANIKMNCDRCLSSFLYPVNIIINETYYDERKALRNIDESGEFISFSGNQIDIHPQLIKAIILALPIKAICDLECKGLCPFCGCNLNQVTCNCHDETLDPRMAKLKDLLGRL